MERLHTWLLGGAVRGVALALSSMASVAFNYMQKDYHFRQGLQFKVEDVADSDRNGVLSVEEMAEVYATLGEDPAKRLREGFYLNIENSQKYLKAKNQFDPQVDLTPTNDHPYFLKAIKEGKPVSYFVETI